MIVEDLVTELAYDRSEPAKPRVYIVDSGNGPAAQSLLSDKFDVVMLSHTQAMQDLIQAAKA